MYSCRCLFGLLTIILVVDWQFGKSVCLTGPDLSIFTCVVDTQRSFGAYSVPPAVARTRQYRASALERNPSLSMQPRQDAR